MKPRPDRSRKLTIRPGKIIFITDRDPRLSGKSVKWTLARVARENGKLTIRRPEIVGIYSCPEFDAYLSGRGKWKSREWRLFMLARWRKSAVRRILHALELRVKNMAASCGDNEKQKMGVSGRRRADSRLRHEEVAA